MEGFSFFSGLGSSKFEILITDLFNAKENTNTYNLFGRSGQKQNGIDIYSGAKQTAIQCKFKNDLIHSDSIVKKLKGDLEASIKEAMTSDLIFDNYILVSNYRDDVNLQLEFQKLKHELECDFDVNYIGVDTLKRWLQQFSEISKIHLVKTAFPFEPIELANITVDQETCAWEPYMTTNEYAFFNNHSDKSKFPVFDFSFINHLDRTIVLKSVKLVAKSLYSGLSGFPTACLLESAHTYRMEFSYDKINILETIPPLKIPKDEGFRFQIQTTHYSDNSPTPISGRNIFYFQFEFSSGITVIAPDVLLNTDYKSDKIKYLILA